MSGEMGHTVSEDNFCTTSNYYDVVEKKLRYNRSGSRGTARSVIYFVIGQIGKSLYLFRLQQ